jgi:hypothetical protein
VRHIRALNSWVIVAGASMGFAVLAGVIGWAAGTQRRGAWLAGVPQMYAQQSAHAADLRQRFPESTLDFGVDLGAITNSIPDPANDLSGLATHVLVQTLFFAAACALIVLLNRQGRLIWAALTPSALIAGIAVSAGPLAFLPGTLGGDLTPSQVPGLSFVYFDTPLWWRLLVAALAALPFAAVWLLSRGPQRQPVALGKTLGALGLFGIIAEAAALVSPQTLVPDGAQAPEVLPTVAVLLVVGCCAVVAGSAGTLRRGAVTGVAMALAGGAAWISAWIVYERGGHRVFGWEYASGSPSLLLGTWQVIALVLAAGALGWAATAATHALTARRPSDFGHLSGLPAATGPGPQAGRW